MKHNLLNTIVQDVLTEEERSKILDDINSFESPRFNQHLGYDSYDIQLSENVIEKLTNIAERISGVKLILKEYNLSRYKNKKTSPDSFEFSPLLFPHTDFFESPRVTLDYQFRTNTDWGIVVDNKDSVTEYVLKDNELLSFSGTNQVHWRNKKIFKEDDFMELIFLHFEPVNAEKLSIDQKNEIKDWAKQRFLEWENTPGKSSNVGTKEENVRRYEKGEKE